MDLIDRQDAIDALSMMQGIVAENGVRKGISMAWQQIKDLPTANVIEAPGWIPVSERLPEHEVLCCDKRGEMMIGYPFYDGDSDTGFSAESEHEFMYSCVAWMPLPEPWKGDRG